MPDTVWLLVTTDPDRMLDEPAPAGALLVGERLVTVHRDFDEMIRYMRHTYDPDGYYEDEGSGSWQNYKHVEGYRFDYQEVKV